MQILPGVAFDNVIENALQEAKCVLVLWSKRSVNSDWVKTEAAYGLAQNMLVPALLQESDIPIGFRRIQAANLIGWEGDRSHPSFQSLVEAVSALIGEPTQKPRLDWWRRFVPVKPKAEKPVAERNRPAERNLDKEWEALQAAKAEFEAERREFAQALAEKERQMSDLSKSQEKALLQKKSIKVENYIFVSYRRSDSEYITGRICDRLQQHFGREAVFEDVHSMPLGVRVRDYIRETVARCKLLLAVIGDEWLDSMDESGNRRLDAPSDFVRLEIEAALDGDKPMIPIFVKRATMPKEQELPQSMRGLVGINGAMVRSDPDFDTDMQRIINGVQRLLETL
jgi:hypothetical protein